MLLLVGVLVAGAYLTIATFTSSTSGGASLKAGDLVFTLTPSTGIVNTASMKPGDTRTGSVQVTNTKQAGTYTLGFSGISGSLAGVLQLTVAQTAPTSKQLYNGTLSAVPALPLGKINAGASITLSFTYAWPSGSRDPSLQGQSIPVVLQWSAQT